MHLVIEKLTAWTHQSSQKLTAQMCRAIEKLTDRMHLSSQFWTAQAIDQVFTVINETLH